PLSGRRVGDHALEGRRGGRILVRGEAERDAEVRLRGRRVGRRRRGHRGGGVPGRGESGRGTRKRAPHRPPRSREIRTGGFAPGFTEMVWSRVVPEDASRTRSVYVPGPTLTDSGVSPIGRNRAPLRASSTAASGGNVCTVSAAS